MGEWVWLVEVGVGAEDAADFCGDVWSGGAGVPCWDGEFGDCAVEVGAGVGDDAVAGFGEGFAWFADADDGVVGDGDGALVHGFEDWVARGEVLDGAAAEVFEGEEFGVEDIAGGACDVGDELVDADGALDEAGEGGDDAHVGDFAAAVGDGDEDDAGDVGCGFEEEVFLDGAFGGGGGEEFFGWGGEVGAVEVVAGVGDLETGDDAAHAVADEDHLVEGWGFAVRVVVLEGVGEGAAEFSGGAVDGEACWVEEVPRLVA